MKTTENAGLARRRRRQSGTELIEFSLSMILLFPIMMSVIILGLNLGRSVRVAQLCRDTDSMYARGVDFSATQNQDIVVRLNNGMGMTRSGGTGLVILSKVTYIPASACTGIPNCNSNQYVVVQRLTIGDSTLHSSQVGPTGAVTLDSHGNVANYMTDPNAVAAGFSSIMTLAANEFTYVTEAFFPSLDLTTIGAPTGGGVYSRSEF
jgi:hypothetical protein